MLKKIFNYLINNTSFYELEFEENGIELEDSLKSFKQVEEVIGYISAGKVQNGNIKSVFKEEVFNERKKSIGYIYTITHNLNDKNVIVVCTLDEPLSTIDSVDIHVVHDRRTLNSVSVMIHEGDNGDRENTLIERDFNIIIKTLK